MAEPAPIVLELWDTLKLADGGTLELRAERPQATLARLGDVSLTLARPGPSQTVHGFSEIFGEISELATRAGDHESTIAAFKEVARTKVGTIAEIAIITHSGEDIRDSYIQSSLWLVATDSTEPAMTKLWSGSGGEFHANFDACLFGVKAVFKLEPAGVIKVHCDRTTTRTSEARWYPACSRSPKMECVDRVVAKLDAKQ